MTSQHPALGIDYGEARIGIAATDPVGIMAHPVETIHRHKTDGVTRIVQLVQERGIRTLVLGIPVRMDGTEGTAAAKVRSAVNALDFNGSPVTLQALRERVGGWVETKAILAACELMGQEVA